MKVKDGFKFGFGFCLAAFIFTVILYVLNGTLESPEWAELVQTAKPMMKYLLWALAIVIIAGVGGWIGMRNQKSQSLWGD